MQVKEFEALIEGELGVVPDGSRVNLGVVDSGITLNHRTFDDPQNPGTTRVRFISDQTFEGRAYFHPGLQIETTIQRGNVSITGSIISPVAGNQLPDPSATQEKTVNLQIDRDGELFNALVSGTSGARLGVLDERGFVGATDMNGDGRTDTVLYTIFLPGPEPRMFVSKDTVIVPADQQDQDFADFRGAVALTDWNATQATMQLGAERVGFNFAPILCKQLSTERLLLST